MQYFTFIWLVIIDLLNQWFDWFIEYLEQSKYVCKDFVNLVF